MLKIDRIHCVRCTFSEITRETHLDTVAGGQLQQVTVISQHCHAAEVAVERPLAESAGTTWSAHIWRAEK